MSQYRYLFGPVGKDLADNLAPFRQAGACLTFGPSAAADLCLSPSAAASWPAVAERLPAGWQPDLLILYLPYTTIPAGMWSAPLPRIGLAADWNLLWSHYRSCLRRCQLILTDSPGVEAMHRAGMSQARPAILYGLDRAFVEHPWTEENRDIDILFVGIRIRRCKEIGWRGWPGWRGSASAGAW